MNLDALISAVVNLREKTERIPSFVWGSVKNVNPVQVLLDGDEFAVNVNAFFGTPETNSRALCLLVSRRVYAFGQTSSTFTETSPSQPNTITIGGRQYTASGSVAVQVGSWAYTKVEGNGTTLQIPFPVDLPPGWTFEVFTLSTYGFSFAQTGSIDRSTRRIHVRVYQYLSRDLNALSRIGWRLTKE